MASRTALRDRDGWRAAACDDDRTTCPDRRPLDRLEIGPAIAAVEAELGGPQQYFEVNATPQVVNVFVATDGGDGRDPVRLRRRRAGPGRRIRARAEGATFAADALTFDPATVLDGLTAELPGSDVVLFTVLGGPGGAVQYTAGVQSSEGGTLDVTLGPDGAVQAVDPGS